MDVKSVLLKMAEGNTKVMIHEVLRPFAAEYIAKSANKVDDILLPFLDELEAGLLKLADKIDGVDGN